MNPGGLLAPGWERPTPGDGLCKQQLDGCTQEQRMLKTERSEGIHLPRRAEPEVTSSSPCSPGLKVMKQMEV
ncbi:hypothetical protein SRHO_G00236670 [Serrasalmus rhombeus]